MTPKVVVPIKTRTRLRLTNRRVNFRILEALSPLAGIPNVRKMIPWFRSNELNMSCLPVNEEIEVSTGNVMPIQILERFIERASHRVIVDFCCCRVSWECKRYPSELGCLMMGESALEIDPTAGREVSVEEAKAHTRMAVENGLVPFVGKARLDNIVFGIRNKKQLLSVCYCCECCCITQYARNIPPALRSENVVRLPGLEVRVTDECDGCGACAKRCFLQEITVVDDRAVIGEGCAGCGRCAMVCKKGAVKITLNNPAFAEEVCERIGALVDYT